MVRPFVWWMTVFVLGELAVYGQNLYLSLLFGTIGLIAAGVGFFLTCKREEEQDKPSGKNYLAMAYFLLCFFFFCMGIQRMEDFQGKCERAECITEDSAWNFIGMIDKVEKKNDYVYLYIKHSDIYWEEEYRGEYAICLITEEETWTPGDWICGSAENQLWNEARNEGNYDEKSYYRSLGILLKGKVKEIAYVRQVFWINQLYGDFCKALWELREKFCQDMEAICDEETAGVYEAILFGTKENLLSETKELYQNAGLAHVICISGIHLSVLGNACYLLLRKKFGFCFSGGSCVLIMLAYTIMTGMQPSTLRALIMFAVRLFADVLGRSYDLANSLSVAVLILLWINPGFYGNAGFWLSVLSVFAIACLAPAWNTFLQIQSALGRGVHSSLVLTLVQLPVVAWNYYQLPLYGMLLNLLVVPCMGMVVGCGILGLAIEQILAGAGRVGIGLGVYLLKCFGYLSRLTASLPMSSLICGKPDFYHLIGYYAGGAIVFIVIFWILHKSREANREENKEENREEDREEDREENREKEELAWYVRYARRAGTGCIIACFLFGLFWKNMPQLEVAYLDVGQGDGIYMQIQGQNFLIDGGSSNVKQVGKYRILPFLKAKGVRMLDGVFISHMDEDHFSGIVELLELTAKGEYKIDTLYLTRHDKLQKDYSEICSLAEQANVKVIYVERGSRLQGKDFRMTCLYPSSQEEGEDKNTLSQVWHLQYRECSFLFTGDLDIEGEERLLQKEKIPKIQVLKVGHHGSKGSSGEEFLQAVSPSLGIISAGVNNRYGHPHQETCERLSTAGIDYAVTKEKGQIRVFSRDGKNLNVEAFAGKTYKIHKNP